MRVASGVILVPAAILAVLSAAHRGGDEGIIPDHSPTPAGPGVLETRGLPAPGATAGDGPGLPYPVPPPALAGLDVGAPESLEPRQGVPPPPLPPPAGAGQVDLPQQHDEAQVIREAQVRLEPDLRQQVLAALEGPRPAHLAFPLGEGRMCDLLITRHDDHGDGEGVVFARVANQPFSHAVLSYVGHAVAGTIQAGDDGLYQVRYAGRGVQRVRQLDPMSLPDDPPALRPSPPPDGADWPGPAMDGEGSTGLADVLLPQEPPPVGDGTTPVASPPPLAAADLLDTVIDLMVVYTPESRAANGGVSGMNAVINAAVASANLAYAQSRAGVSLRLVYAGEVSYKSSGSLNTDIGRLRGTSDGYMDTIHALRDKYKADLVSLFVPAGSDGYAGIGYLLVPATMSSYLSSYAFTTVVDIYADANLSLAHEIGHNLGAGHAADDSSPNGAYAYSHGYRFVVAGTTYRTVMAYAPGVRVAYLSSPSVSYLGTPAGTADADNAATFRADKAAIAACRTGTPEWSVSTGADFNGDGKPDLVWRGVVSGRVIDWQMDGATTTATTTLWPAANAGDSAWIPVASGDFNSDGQDDLLWRNSSNGRAIFWYMSGTTRIGTAAIWSPASAADLAWVPHATGDFNGDGRKDIVWRNTSTGRVIAWFMNGATRTGTAEIWPATNTGDSAWVPMTAGDFNGDGQVDLVWRNSSSGRVIVWLMNGVARTGTAVLWAGGTASDAVWVPQATGDFNGDGQTDLVWRNSSTGRVIIWYLNGVTRTGTVAIWE